MAGGGGGVAANQDTLSGEPVNSYGTGGMTLAQNNMSSGSGGFMPSQPSGSGYALNQNPSEPVVKYGTGGRISGFAEGGDVRSLAKYGRNGDTILAHINPQEARLLKRLGGSGTINPVTGLPEFMLSDHEYNFVQADGFGDAYDIFNDGGYGGDVTSGGYGGSFDQIDDNIPEIEIVDNRPAPVDDDIPEIEIVGDKPARNPFDDIPLIDAPPIDITLPPIEEDIPEIIIPGDRPVIEPPPYNPPIIESPPIDITIPPVEPPEPPVVEPPPPPEPPVVEPPPPPEPPVVEPPEPPVEPPVEPPPPPWEPPVPPWEPPPPPPRPPVEPPVPPVQPPVQPPVTPTNDHIYHAQYQNYADPLTMFNVSNYGRDVPTSAGYNYAAGHQGIAALNQNLRDYADRQMSQPGGANMNDVLASMRGVGLTATDLENARYGRMTGLNTPFSQYNTQAPTAEMFGAVAPQAAPVAPAGPGMAAGGIAALISALPS